MLASLFLLQNVSRIISPWPVKGKGKVVTVVFN